MHNTHIPLWKWFYAISLLAEAKKSISSRQVSRHLGISVPTAYKLTQRIKKGIMGTRSPILKGVIKIDETYIGEKPKSKGKRNIHKRERRTNKAMVVGMVERGGKTISMSVSNGEFKQNYVREIILSHVDIDKSEIHTDEYPVYNRVGGLTPHDRVNHQAKEYVRGKTPG